MAEQFRATALKHRPQRFGDLIGQDHIARSLSNAITGNRIGHAFLFSGPRGVGKTSTARILAKSLNCEKGPTPEPCGQCSHCLEITASSHLDVFEIDGASNRGIDQIRELRESVNYSPSRARYKIYIIDEVHMLSNEAFNALLKTLEEPPQYVIFIFATTEPAKVKITIRSRTQHYRFKRIPTGVIADHLAKICADSGITAEKEALFLIARSGDGSMRDAQSLLDQVIAYAGGSFGVGHARDIIGLIDSSTFFDFLTFILEKDARSLLEMVAEMDDQGLDFNDFINGLAAILRNLILFIEGTDPTTLEMVPEDVKTLSSFYDESSQEGFSEDDIIILLDTLVNLARDMQPARNPRRILELYLFKLINFRNMIRPEEILARIEKLQIRMNGLQSYHEEGGPPLKKTGAQMPIEISSGKQPTPTAPKPTPQPPAPPQPAPQQPAPQPPAPETPAPAPVRRPEPPTQSDGTALLQQLINEQLDNFLLGNALNQAASVSIDGNHFVLYYRAGDNFYREQVETEYSDLINSFLSDNTQGPLTLTVREGQGSAGGQHPAPQPVTPPQEPEQARPQAATQQPAPTPAQPPVQQQPMAPTQPAPPPRPPAQPPVENRAPAQPPPAPDPAVEQIRDLFQGDIIDNNQQ